MGKLLLSNALPLLLLLLLLLLIKMREVELGTFGRNFAFSLAIKSVSTRFQFEIRREKIEKKVAGWHVLGFSPKSSAAFLNAS